MKVNTPKRRFKEFQNADAWEQRELGEIANIIPGGTPKTTVKDYWWPKEIPWMSSGEINKRIVEKTDDMISKNGFENSSAKLIKEKSVLIALAGQGKTRGLVAVNEVPLTTNQSIAAFEIEANITNYKFLFYTLDRQYMRLRHISSGDGTRGGLNKKLLESYKSHFPVLEEQNHISEFISKIENLITLHKRKFEKLKQLQKSYLNESIFSEPKCVPKRRFKGFTDAWEQRELGELSNIRRGASPRPISDPKWFSNESDIGWIRISDVTEQNGRIKNVEQKLSNLGMEKTLILDEGELILSIAASVGKPVINYIKTGIHDGFIVFLNPQFHRDFMFAWLERNQFIWNRYGQPGSQVNINSEIVKKQKVLLPNIKEQEKISNMILKFEYMINLHKHKHNAIKKLQKIYLQNILEDETYA